MKEIYKIFTHEQYADFCYFINGLAKLKKKFHITPWVNTENINMGFVVWYYIDKKGKI